MNNHHIYTNSYYAKDGQEERGVHLPVHGGDGTLGSPPRGQGLYPPEF